MTGEPVDEISDGQDDSGDSPAVDEPNGQDHGCVADQQRPNDEAQNNGHPEAEEEPEHGVGVLTLGSLPLLHQVPHDG